MADVQASAPAHSSESITDAAAQDAPATNGDAPSTAAENIDAGNGETTEVKDVDGETVAVAVADDTPDAASNGAKGASKGKRKSSAGVPEHKSKKLNKKKSMVTLNLGLEPGDYVWARLKGYPPWPSIVCDEAMLPEILLATRPVSAKRPDGTYREDFLEGGKNERDRKFPVMFLSTNEFAWMVNTGLTKLEKSELEREDAKRAPALSHAYVIAAEGHDLEYFKNLLRQHEQEQKEIEKELTEKEEQKAAQAEEKAKKKAEQERRKSKAGAEDSMDVDGENKPSKKRKKEAESDGEGKPKKTPKVKAAKEPKPESAAKSKPKKKAAKEEAAPELTEAQRLDRREKAVFFIRHKLQRSLLSGSTAPADDEMPALAEHFTQLEQYKDLEPQLIRKTKIHKVLKNIVRLDSIPRDEEFQLKKRSAEMLSHWNSVLATSTEGETPAAESAPAPTTNGNAQFLNGKPRIEEIFEEDKPATDDNGDITMADASTVEVKPEADKAALPEKPAETEKPVDTTEATNTAAVNGTAEDKPAV